jgi:hypothetical protein
VIKRQRIAVLKVSIWMMAVSVEAPYKSPKDQRRIGALLMSRFVRKYWILIALMVWLSKRSHIKVAQP